MQNGADAFHGFGRGVDADDGIAAAIQQAVKCREQDSRRIVRRMVGLQANAQHAALAHGVAAARDHANLVRGQHQVLVAHQLGYGGGNFRRDGPVQGFQAASSVSSLRMNSRNSPTVMLLMVEKLA